VKKEKGLSKMTINQAESKEKAEIMTNVDLSEENSLGVRSVADRYTKIDNLSQIEWLYKKGELREPDIFVLGGGSNVLFAERVKRLLLKIEIKGIEITGETHSHVLIRAGAGENWHKLVSWCVKHDFGGIENLALIPGTTGAAPVQNIGAYGVELEQVFHSLEAFDMKTGNLVTFEKKDCEFAYRDSVFKGRYKNRFIITRLNLKLTKRDHSVEYSYRSLQERLDAKKIRNPGIPDIYETVIEIRKSKLPDPSDIGNAGSFFKNPVISDRKFSELKREYQDIPSYQADENRVKIPAGWLIEKAGWKGRRIGNVGTYENQALVIVNHGGAAASEIYEYALNILKSVKELFGIELVPEVNLIGEF